MCENIMYKISVDLISDVDIRAKIQPNVNLEYN